MKIERLTENKIKIILNADDIKEKNIDLHTFLTNTPKSQAIFSDILDIVEKEIGFCTNNCKIIIEAISVSDGGFILTITRFLPDYESVSTFPTQKRLRFKRKVPSLNFRNSIYSFSTFDLFCDFCNYLNKLNHNLIFYIESFSTKISLYLYCDKYYFIISDFDIYSSDESLNFTDIKTKDFASSFLTELISKKFCASIVEFGSFVSESSIFESKLKEFGDCIFSENALTECLKYFHV